MTLRERGDIIDIDVIVIVVIEREMEDSESSTNFSQSLYHILSFSCNLSSNLMESQYKMAGDT